MPNELKAITSQLGAAYMTEHGDLLCRPCVERNKGQLARAGIGLELVPCHGVMPCALCDRSATDTICWDEVVRAVRASRP